MRHDQIDDDYRLESGDYKIFAALIGVVMGFTLFAMGMFLHGDIYAIGLPLWIFSTVYLTRGLTFEFMHDINDALDVNK